MLLGILKWMKQIIKYKESQLGIWFKECTFHRIECVLIWWVVHMHFRLYSWIKSTGGHSHFANIEIKNKLSSSTHHTSLKVVSLKPKKCEELQWVERLIAQWLNEFLTHCGKSKKMMFNRTLQKLKCLWMFSRKSDWVHSWVYENA